LRLERPIRNSDVGYFVPPGKKRSQWKPDFMGLKKRIIEGYGNHKLGLLEKGIVFHGGTL